jgi:hypothetical protein
MRVVQGGQSFRSSRLPLQGPLRSQKVGPLRTRRFNNRLVVHYGNDR